MVFVAVCWFGMASPFSLASTADLQGLPAFLSCCGLVEFAFHNATDESADAGALSAESVQLGLDLLGELNHHAFHFHGQHLLC